ncbi:MAG: hypothetical protein IJT87_12450 [Ruminiclostridium sp.]|nr:hypothetical protein [Clostridia bacterium]MBQ9385033.1 hypothetical protein [Ruminiclostridium sp.]
MTLDQLEAYRANRTELEAVGDELAGYETQIAVQSAAEFPYSLHTATQTGLPNVPRVKTLLDRQARLRASCAAVERFAESVDDYELRRIIELRFMSQGKKPSWQEIALKLKYRSEHTPYRKLTGYLLNMHKKR